MENNENTQNDNITLDGQVVSKEQLEEAKKNATVRITEVGPNQYRTLQRMQG